MNTIRRSPELAGRSFGQWTVLERVRSRKNILKWRCLCSCGTVRHITTTSLTGGHTTRCQKCNSRALSRFFDSDQHLQQLVDRKHKPAARGQWLRY